METQQQLIAVKAKRRRSSSPHNTASSTSPSSGDTDPRYTNTIAESDDQFSPASSSEEEDMAYCLILLAQGHAKPPPHDHDADESCCRVNNISSGNKAGFFAYDCKTCNRSFPSFQALGGHRASHKKPKSAISDHQNKLNFTVPAVVVPPPSIEDRDFDCQLYNQNLPPVQNPPNFSVQKGTNNKWKIHECSICGSEFSSGQALGGHMRRHRANNNNPVMATAIEHQVKPRSMLALDLNLPAPEDDHRHRHSTQQTLAFSTPALVDCYY